MDLAIYEKIAQLYQKGLSFSDISKQTGKAKSTIQGILTKAKVELRPNRSIPATSTWKRTGKSNIRPPYGFCYLQGKVVPDPREYENLLIIYKLWVDKINPNAIATRLNAKNIPARSAPTWNRNSIVNILNRFKNKSILIKGDSYELR